MGELANKTLKKADRIKKSSKFASDFIRRVPMEGVICGPKCTMCCKRMPYIRSSMEEEYILSVLGDVMIPGRVRKEVQEAVRAVRTAWVDMCNDLGYNPTHPADPVEPEIAWAGRGISCPLLDEHGLCLIYPRSPFDCRLTLKNQSVCTTPLENPINPIAGWSNQMTDLCHKIDKALERKPYLSKPFIEVLAQWVTA